jgi:hypothetical protein
METKDQKISRQYKQQTIEYLKQVDLKKKQLDQLIERIKALEILKEEKLSRYRLIYYEIVKNKQKQRSVSTVQMEIDRLNFLLEMSKKSVSLISPKELEEIIKYNNPPERVKLALEAVMFLLNGRKMDWDAIRSEISQRGFITRIIKFNPRHPNKSIIDIVKNDYLNAKWFEIDKIKNASQAAGPLAEWILSQINYIQSLDKIEPIQYEFNNLKIERLELENKEMEFQDEITNIKTMIDIAYIQKDSLQMEIKELEGGFEPKNNLAQRISHYLTEQSVIPQNERRSTLQQLSQLGSSVIPKNYNSDYSSANKNISIKKVFDIQTIPLIIQTKSKQSNLTKTSTKNIQTEDFSLHDTKPSTERRVSNQNYPNLGKETFKIQRNSLNNNSFSHSKAPDVQGGPHDEQIDSACFTELEKQPDFKIDGNTQTHLNNMDDILHQKQNEFSSKRHSHTKFQDDKVEFGNDQNRQNVISFNNQNKSLSKDRDLTNELNPSSMKRFTKKESRSEINFRHRSKDEDMKNSLCLSDISTRGDHLNRRSSERLKQFIDIGIQADFISNSDLTEEKRVKKLENAIELSSNDKNMNNSSFGVIPTIDLLTQIDDSSKINAQFSKNDYSEILSKPAKYNDFNVSTISFLEKLKSEPSIYSNPSELIQRIDDQIKRYSERINDDHHFRILKELEEKYRRDKLETIDEQGDENALNHEDSVRSDNKNMSRLFNRQKTGSFNDIPQNYLTFKKEGSRSQLTSRSNEKSLQSQVIKVDQSTITDDKFITNLDNNQNDNHNKRVEFETQSNNCQEIKPLVHQPLNFLNGNLSQLENPLFRKAPNNNSSFNGIHQNFIPVNGHYIIPQNPNIIIQKGFRTSNIPIAAKSTKIVYSQSQMNSPTLIRCPNQTFDTQKRENDIFIHGSSQNNNNCQPVYSKNFQVPIKFDFSTPTQSKPNSIRSTYIYSGISPNETPKTSIAVNMNRSSNLHTLDRSPVQIQRVTKGPIDSTPQSALPLVTKANPQEKRILNLSQEPRPSSADFLLNERRLMPGTLKEGKILKSTNVNGRLLYLIRVDDKANIYRYAEDIDK